MKNTKNQRPKWRLRIEQRNPRKEGTEVVELEFAHQWEAMRHMRRRLLALWLSKAGHFRIGVNPLRCEPWTGMSFELSEGVFVADSALGKLENLRRDMKMMMNRK